MIDTLIIGGGLCGLALAEVLDAQGHDYLLLEARDRVGGRILSVPAGSSAVDLGPAWFWPGQPRIAAMTERLGLRKFSQFASGNAMFEDESGVVQMRPGFVPFDGSWRLVDGLGMLTEALVARLPKGRVRLCTKVKGLSDAGDGIRLTLSSRESLRARRVVLALPPRLAKGLLFAPMLPEATLSALGQLPTWMAGCAKVVAVYPTPFWRTQGLSGDVMSRRGPLAEIHDASPADASFGALFGFVAVPPSGRWSEAALRAAVIAQFEQLFGGAAPLSLHIKDWATDAFTATAADAKPLRTHPAYGLPEGAQSLWEGRVLLSGTETAPIFGGFLEGALEAAEAAALQLSTR